VMVGEEMLGAALAAREQILEYGLRSHFFGSGKLAYERMVDGSLRLHEPHGRGFVRVQPPGVGSADAIRLVLITIIEGQHSELGGTQIQVNWDEASRKWWLTSPGDGTDIAAAAWRQMSAVVDCSWIWPRVT